MKSLVVISAFLALSIDLCASQFAAILQPKAIRDGAAFHQEIFYGSSQPNTLQQQQTVSRLNFPQPLVQRLVTVPTRPTTTIAAENDDFENTPRSIQSVRKVPALKQQVVTFPQVATAAATTEHPRTTTEALTPEELEEQAKSAHYKFGTSVHDTINDHEHVRQEHRDGLALKGMYSYSDGFFRRTVHYEADEGGYRVIKEEIEPITGDGPKFNPKGQAEVKSSLSGDYSITVDDFRLNKQQEKILKGN